MPAHRIPPGLRILASGPPRAADPVAGAESAVAGLDFGLLPEVLDEVGATAWQHLANVFVDQPTRFSEADRAAVVSFCVAWSLHARAARALMDEGLQVRGRSAPDRGRQVRHPAWGQWRDAGNALRLWCRELGLTPDSRSRAGITDADPMGKADGENPFSGQGEPL